MNKLRLFGYGAAATGALMLTQVHEVMAACDVNAGIGEGAACAAPIGAKNNLFSQGGIFQTISTVLIFIVGAVSVIMLIVGGLRYVLSSGEASAVKGAKDTILYSIIGIVVAILAYAAVAFVIQRLSAAQ
jgi:hypothetical protein